MLSRMVFVLLFIFSASSFAGGYLVPLSLEGVSVNKYFVHSTGAITFFVTGDVQNPDGCFTAKQVHIRHDTVGREEMAAAVMMAFATGKKIGMYSSRCEVIPFWGGTNQYPIISNLWVNN